MDKTLQTTAWNCLPKEFKEEVKKIYSHNPGAKPMPENTSRGKAILRDIFGHDNLTSDAEGEEMLYVKAKTVREMYAANDRLIAEFIGSEIAKDAAIINNMLRRLYSSKCLPDNVDSLEYLEPKANGYTPIPEKTYLSKWNKTDLKPAGPEEKTSEKRVENEQERVENEQSRNLSQETANCDKQLDNILKDSSREHNRLHIAAMAMQGILANPNPQMVNMDVHKVADLAILMSETLIAEAERGGKYGED